MATTSRTIITSPIAFCLNIPRCLVPNTWVSANSMVEKIPLADQIKPPSDRRPIQPADCFTPVRACMSCGWAVLGNS